MSSTCTRHGVASVIVKLTADAPARWNNPLTTSPVSACRASQSTPPTSKAKSARPARMRRLLSVIVMLMEDPWAKARLRIQQRTATDFPEANSRGRPRHFHRLEAPDILGVFANRAVTGEFAHARGVEDGHLR